MITKIKYKLIFEKKVTEIIVKPEH